MGVLGLDLLGLGVLGLDPLGLDPLGLHARGLSGLHARGLDGCLHARGLSGLHAYSLEARSLDFLRSLDLAGLSTNGLSSLEGSHGSLSFLGLCRLRALAQSLHHRSLVSLDELSRNQLEIPSLDELSLKCLYMHILVSPPLHG